MSAPVYLDTHTAIVGASGAGKTVTAKDQVELLLDDGRHVCILDPTGAWWGLRSDAAGEGEGFPIPIFGGSHGDVPIAADQGEAVGKIIADGVSAIVDISQLRTGAEQRRFARDMGRALRAKPDGNFHFVIDEADEFASQKPRDDFGFQVGEELIWMAKRGRLAGFVLTLITQRPASIDKEVLTQAQTVIIHQLVAPVDQKPIVDYLKDNADKATLAKIKGSLASLDRGERWIYSPRLGLLERGVSPMPRTFDSSRTPEPGENPVGPKLLAQIDLGAIAAQLKPEDEAAPAAATNIPENIPDELRKALDEQAKLIKANAECAKVIADQLDEIAALQRVAEDAYDRGKRAGISIGIQRARAAIDGLQVEKIAASAADQERPQPEGQPKRIVRKEPAAAVPVHSTGTAGETAGKADHPPRHQRILDALAWAVKLLGKDAVERNIVAWFAETSPKSSGYQNDLGAMRTAGLIDYPSAGMLSLTQKGGDLANWPATPPTKDSLVEAIKRRLEPRFHRIIDAVFAAHSPLSREELADEIGISASSSGFQNDLGKLRTLGIIDYPKPGLVWRGRVLQ